MGHSFLFLDFPRNGFLDVLTESDIKDAIGLMFEGPDSKFTIVGKEVNKKFAGSCMPVMGGYVIRLSPDNIFQMFVSGTFMGGNKRKPHGSLKAAVLSVLAHEVRHASQDAKIGRNIKNVMWSRNKGSESRPCEVDARKFADDNIELIDMIAGDQLVPVTKKQDSSFKEVADVLTSAGVISDTEIENELRAAGLFNPINMKKIKLLTSVK